MTPEVLYQFKDCAGELFRPPNGTDGMIFSEAFCEQCIHERWIHHQDENREKDKCEIWSNVLIFDVSDNEYPPEWIFNEEGWPVCTNWQKFDWGDDHDGWNEPPEPPYEPQDPNQLMLFSIADDILENHVPQQKEKVEL